MVRPSILISVHPCRGSHGACTASGISHAIASAVPLGCEPTKSTFEYHRLGIYTRCPVGFVSIMHLRRGSQDAYNGNLRRIRSHAAWQRTCDSSCVCCAMQLHRRFDYHAGLRGLVDGYMSDTLGGETGNTCMEGNMKPPNASICIFQTGGAEADSRSRAKGTKLPHKHGGSLTTSHAPAHDDAQQK